MKRIAILGAGLSGLTAGWHLHQKGYQPVLFEASAHYGGPLRSGCEEGFLFEYGPNSLLNDDSDLAALITELNLTSQVVQANPLAKKRFVVRDGKVLPLPMNLMGFMTTPLLSFKAKLVILTEPFRFKSKLEDETLAVFTKRRLGSEVLDYLLNPFLSGVYAGTPETLSTKYAFPSLWQFEQTYGSLCLGLLKKKRSKKTLISFQDGIQTLCIALACPHGMNLKLNTPVREITKENSAWKINGETFDAVLSTLPTHAFNQVPIKPDYLKLKALHHPPLTVWHLGFKREQIQHPLDGFGMLVPAVEKLNILGCLFPSTLFPNRSNLGDVLLTVFVGGCRQPELASLSEEDSLALVLKDLGKLLKITGYPYWKKSISWPQAIPQYDMNYSSFLHSLEQIESTNRGWFFAGNFHQGISAPQTISSGKRAAQRIQSYLNIEPSS